MLGLLLYLVFIPSFGPHLCHGMECNNSEVTVPDGQPACIICNMFPPKPGVLSWYRKDRQPPEQFGSDDRFVVDNNGTLYFSYVRPSDTGVYGCSTINNSSINFGKNVTLNVTSATGSNQTKPQLLWSSGNMTRSNLHPKELTCVFAGRPIPNITWLHNDEIVITGVQTDGMKSTLNPSENIPPTTKYTCIGENSAGKERQDIILISYRRRNLLKWIWAGLGVMGLITALAIGRCCHRWCSWKRKRRIMLRKEAEGYRMVHEEEAEGYRMIHEEAETSNTSETKKHEDPSGESQKLEIDNCENVQEEIDSHTLMREETENHDNQKDWTGENEVKHAEEIEADLKCVQGNDDYGGKDEETESSGKKSREKNNHPAEVGHKSAGNGDFIGNKEKGTNGMDLKEGRTNSCGDEKEEIESYGDSAVQTENRRMNEVFAPCEQEKQGSSKEKTEETVNDQGLEGEASKAIGVVVTAGGNGNNYKSDRETNICGKSSEEKETIDTEMAGNKTVGESEA